MSVFPATLDVNPRRIVVPSELNPSRCTTSVSSPLRSSTVLLVPHLETMAPLLESLLSCPALATPRTKIVCTLGPSSRTVAVLEELLTAGMTVARFNFSHGDHEYHQATLDNLRIACKNTRLMCASMLDTKGPEIRTGELEGGGPVT